MTIYVKLEPNGSGIVGFATQLVAGLFDIEAELPEPFDPELLAGYELKFNPDRGVNEAVFNVLRWRQAKTKADEESRQRAANEALNEALRTSALTLATDEQAVAMMDMYPAWEANKEMAKGARLTYNGALYKVIQAHTSQAGWEPTQVPALFVRLSEPEDEWPDFVQPTGAHDVYMTGDKVTYDDVHYICKADNVAHSPEDLPDAWEKQEEK